MWNVDYVLVVVYDQGQVLCYVQCVQGGDEWWDIEDCYQLVIGDVEGGVYEQVGFEVQQY